MPTKLASELLSIAQGIDLCPESLVLLAKLLDFLGEKGKVIRTPTAHLERPNASECQVRQR